MLGCKQAIPQLQDFNITITKPLATQLLYTFSIH